MTGIAGMGRGVENAEKLAVFFNRMQPERVVNFSLFLSQNAPLYRNIQENRFIPADEIENLVEARRLLELLETDSLLFDGFHDRLSFRVRGTIPRDREKMLRKLDDAIEVYRRQAPIVAYS